MKFIYFTQSILSDWNNGNAHFLRGVATELISRGHEVIIFEPSDGWSLSKLKQFYGNGILRGFHEVFPTLKSNFYDPDSIDLEKELDSADIVIVHEWNDPQMIKKIGNIRKRNHSFNLFFHDTHHRAVSGPENIEKMDLTNYDGVLAFGEVLRNLYLQNNWAQKAWTWHEAADVRIFKPLDFKGSKDDVVWIGNWGDEERSSELKEYIFDPVKDLQLVCKVYGVRYPQEALTILKKSDIQYLGWLPNYKVPQVFSQSRLTIHVPRRPYVRMLPGIPTIRVFEALACGIPLISSQWDDCENLLTEGKDYLMVNNGEMMKEYIKNILENSSFADELGSNGRNTILKKHTCAHRVDELLEICNDLRK
jgi:spore maturation protein CgeB